MSTVANTSWSPPLVSATNNNQGDKYLRILAMALLGYALLGKGFAYIGVSPIFIGEILLFAGLLTIGSTRQLGTALSRTPFIALMAFMCWGLIRTVPYISRYGVVSIRDGAIYGYGLYAFIVATLLIESPPRLRRLVGMYARFVPLFLILAPLLWFVREFFESHIPAYPGTGVPIIGANKGGDYSVHLVGIYGFMVLLQPELGLWRYIFLMAAGLVINMPGRAALVAIFVGFFIITVAKPLARNATRVWVLVAAGILLLWATNFSMVDPGMGRDISITQLTQNIESIVSDSGNNDDLNGTKQWRIDWWKTIIGYTVHGKYFWTGKGFGINLADDDGFQVSQDGSLRSPHNGHLTVLARAGVPGLALWALVQITFMATLVDGWYRAKRSGQERWALLFVVLLAYWAAFLANAAFDVYLEGPVGGIWFWCIYGVGVGARWIFDHDPQALDGAPRQAAVAGPGR